MSSMTNQLILEQIPACIAWKDKELKYRGANKNLLANLNLQYLEELIGFDENELALHTPQMNTFFHQQDLLVLEGQELEIIHRLEDSSDDKTYFLKKAPLRDESNQIIGIIYQCMPWSQVELLTLLKQIDGKYQAAVDVPSYYEFDTHRNPANLSQRELECLFLLLRGRTVKQTAEMLGLSKRTAESYIDNIKSKLGCLNKAELLVTAMIQGYQHHIPKSLLKLNLSELFKI